MVLEIFAVVLVGFLVYVWLTYYKLSGVYVVRYSRPDCPYCVSSQADWEKFKSLCSNLSAEDKAKVPEVTCVDVNNGNDWSLDTQMWRMKYKPAAVPQIIVLVNDKIEEFNGKDNTTGGISQFMKEIFTKYNLYKK